MTDEPEEMSPTDRSRSHSSYDLAIKAMEERDNDRMNMVEFTQESWHRFKDRYAQAVLTAEEQFTFEGHEFVTAFAKYFIEFHNNKFASAKHSL